MKPCNILTISWLNLDLGIETCFFDGMDAMDAYVKTWLQFVFPLYVWSLVCLIIIISKYSSKITRVFGSNPVAVLATLFLLSYAKLLRFVPSLLYCISPSWTILTKYPVHSWQEHYPFSCSFANISGPISSLHLHPHCGTVASIKVQSQVLL